MPRLAPELRLSPEGSCSFCGAPRSAQRGLVQSTVLDVRVCDDCLGVSCCLLADTAGVLDRAPGSSGSEFPDDLLREITTLLASIPPKPNPPVNIEFRCSFCGGARPADVAHLVVGPRIFICSACVASAVALVKAPGA